MLKMTLYVGTHNIFFERVHQRKMSRTEHTIPEEQDQLRQSVKKHKRAAAASADFDERNLDYGPTAIHIGEWRNPSFAEVLNNPQPRPPLYTGEGEDDILDDFSLTDILQEPDVVEEGELCPVVYIPWDSYKQSWQQWRRALVIRVLGKTFSFRILEPRIRKLWQLEHDCELIDIDKGYLVARFYSQEDYLKVINGGPWTVLDHYLTISKWTPNLKPGETEISRTLVWLRLPRLPLEMFVESTLLRVGNVIGRAIKVDSFTGEMIKGRYARVCVELDLHGPLPPNVLIWGRKQAVEYEGLHHICYQCGRYGHKKDQCPLLANPTGGEGDRAGSLPPKPTGGTAAQPFGPWMLPAHVRQKKHLAQARMNRRALSSKANRRLNAEIEKQLKVDKLRNPNSNGSTSVSPGSNTGPQGLQATSGPQSSPISAGRVAGLPSNIVIQQADPSGCAKVQATPNNTSMDVDQSTGNAGSSAPHQEAVAGVPTTRDTAMEVTPSSQS